MQISHGESPAAAVIGLRARVTRVTDLGMALEITEILGTDSYRRLRDLIMGGAHPAG